MSVAAMERAGVDPIASKEGVATISAIALTGFRDLVIRLGGDPDQLLQGAGLGSDIPLISDETISFGDFAKLLEDASKSLLCYDFGIQLARAQLGSKLMGPIVRLLETAPTVGDLLQHAASYVELYSSAFRINLDRNSPYGRPMLCFEFIANDVPYRRQVTEKIIALSYWADIQRTGGIAQPREIWFSHNPLSVHPKNRPRFRCPVRYSQPLDAMFYSEKDLATPVLTSRPEAHALEIQNISQRHPPKHKLSSDVKITIRQLLMTDPCTREYIAEKLGVHPRTLHRRLREEGVTFETLKDEVRQELILHYLAQSDLALEQLAERIGYAELSVLSRSCRRWFGVSPRGLRRRLLTHDLKIREPRF